MFQIKKKTDSFFIEDNKIDKFIKSLFVQYKF